MAIDLAELLKKLRKERHVILVGRDYMGRRQVRKSLNFYDENGDFKGGNTIGVSYELLFYEGQKRQQYGSCDINTLAKWAIGYLSEEDVSREEACERFRRRSDINLCMKSGFYYIRKGYIEGATEFEFEQALRAHLEMPMGAVRYQKGDLVRKPVRNPRKTLTSVEVVLNLMHAIGLKVKAKNGK